MDEIAPPQQLILSVDHLTQARWKFGQKNHPFGSDNFYFGTAGLIEGYKHDNEHRWTFEADEGLKIFTINGLLMWETKNIDFENNIFNITLTSPFIPDAEFVLVEFTDIAIETTPAPIATPAAVPPPVSKAPLKPKDFLFPKDLQVSETVISNVLLIGSCLTSRYYEQFSALKPDVEFEFITFNFGSILPEKSPEEIKKYDFQYIQIALPSVLTDRIIIATKFNDPDFANQILTDGYNIIDMTLKSALAYNASHEMLSFVANFYVPQMSRAPYLQGSYSLVDLSHIVRKFNEHLAQEITKYKNVFLADVNAIGDSLGKQYFMDDMIDFMSHNSLLYQYSADLDNEFRIEPAPPMNEYYLSRVEDLIGAVYDQMIALYRICNQTDQVKAVVFDLDNTLWRGQLAEHFRPDREHWPYPNGWPMGIWEAIHHLRARGILVAICSKNDLSTVEEYWTNAVRSDWLSLKDFVSVKINWRPKSENILEICSELNIKPKSVVFVDDNPIERASVQAAIPDIRAIGANPNLVKRILLWSPETQIPYLTNESSRREEMIRGQINRETERTSLSRQDFLDTLQTCISFAEIKNTDNTAFTRILELTNKTNQFNTSGKRWTREDAVQFFTNKGKIYSFSVVDKFADYGLVGVIFVEGNKINQFIMSCRIMGMDIERAAIFYVVKQIRAQNKKAKIQAFISPTKDNAPSHELFKQSGFKALSHNNSNRNFVLEPNQNCKLPVHISIV